MLLNPIDPKWLQILKASGWQTTALTLACVLIITLIKGNIIPTTDSPLWIAIPSIFALVFGCLSLAAIGSALFKIFRPLELLNQWHFKRKKIKEIEKFIPYMADKDREIIGHLLHHKQKGFQADQDGGYAAPLISKGIIVVSARRGQILDLTRVPYEIPDYIWTVLEENSVYFQYEASPDEKNEVNSWSIPWMAK